MTVDFYSQFFQFFFIKITPFITGIAYVDNCAARGKARSEFINNIAD